MEEEIKKLTRKDLLINLYNERLNRLVRLEVDERTAQAVVIMQPNNKQILKKKAEVDLALPAERKNMEIIEKLLLAEESPDKEAEEKEPESGKEN